MSAENRREILMLSRDVILDIWCRVPRPPRVFNLKRYLIVGIFLIGLYVFQYLSDIQWLVMSHMQDDLMYKQLSGCIVLLLLLYQWQLARSRNFNKGLNKCSVLKNHKWVGAILPLPFFFHAMQPGYGYLYFLTISFLACITLGLFNVETVKVRNKTCLFIWTLLHILFAVISLLLVVFHIYVVYAYS